MAEVYGNINYWQRLWLHGLATDERLGGLSRGLQETERTLPNRAIRALESTVGCRRFCISRTRRYVLVGGSANVGDMIYVPLGCSTPIVLRKERTEYKFVGDAYVDGYMHGLAIDELERGEKHLESIVLI